jgi:hypothetical protein
MRDLSTAVLAAALGAGCGTVAAGTAAPTATHGSQPHAHEPSPPHEGHGAGGHDHAFADADVWTEVFDDPARDDSHRGPPAEMRVAPEAIIAALESAGLSASVSPVALPDQYIVEAQQRP